MPPSPTFWWEIHVRGTASVAGQPHALTLFLLDGRPAVILLDAIPTLNLSTLFDWFFSGLEWPSDIFDLTLADSYIFYSSVPGTEFQKLSGLPQDVLDQWANVQGEGLFVATIVSLTLADKVFTFSANISAFAGKGFIVAGDLSAPINFLDADILYITSPKSSESGPSLSVQSFNDKTKGTLPHFTLNCGFTLFGFRFDNAALTLSRDSPDNPPMLAAQLRYKGTIAGLFKNPELDFTWSSDAGFVIQNFPLLSLPNLPLDFAALLKKVSQTESCGMAGLILNDALKIQTNFKVTPSLSNAGGSVAVLINGFYKIGAQGTSIATITLPQLSFSPPANFTFDGISDQFIKTIVANGELVVKALWDDKAALLLFFSVFVTKQVLKTVLSNLVCADQDLADELQKLDNELEQTDSGEGGGDGGGGDGGGGGGGGGGGTSVNIGPLIGAGLKALGKMIGSSGKGLGVLGKGLSSLASGIGSLFGDDDDDDDGPPPPPQDVNATYSAKNNTCTVTWAFFWFFSSNFDFQLVDSTGRVLKAWEQEGDPNDTTSVSNTTPIPIDPSTLPAGVYTIKARMNFFVGLPGSIPGDWGQTTIAKLAPASNVVVSGDQTGESVTIQWDSVSGATQYTLEVRDADTSTQVLGPLSIPSTGAGSVLKYVFTAAELSTLAAGSYIFSVQASADDSAIPSGSFDAPSKLSKLAAPASVNQAAVSGGLRVTWSPVGNQTTYRIRIFNYGTSAEALNLIVVMQTMGTAGLLEKDLSFDQFLVKSPGQYLTTITVLGDAAHIASNPVVSSALELFGGIGYMQIGTTFTVS